VRPEWKDYESLPTSTMAGPDRKRRIWDDSTTTPRVDKSAVNSAIHSSADTASGMAHVCNRTTNTPLGTRTRTHSSRPVALSLHS
jgi:hypothetical protein